jgi:hypothetical protein
MGKEEAEMAPFYVCAKCENEHVPSGLGSEMKPERNGVYVIEMADFGPYKIWMADLWICPKCGHKVIAGFGVTCIVEHYQPNFAGWLESARASGAVYYC